MKQSDMKSLAHLLSLLPEDALMEVLNTLDHLERVTGCKWYPDAEYLIDAQIEREQLWEKQAETKASAANVNSLMF